MSDRRQLYYIPKSMMQMSAGEYGKAFQSLIRGLERNLKDADHIRSRDLISAFLLLSVELESSLERDYGVGLAAISRPHRKPVLACGYCGRRKRDTKVLMGGGGGPICDRCAKQFNDLAEATLKAKAAKRTRSDRRGNGGR